MARTSFFRRLFGSTRFATKPVHRFRPAIESLELRDVPAVFTVNTLADENNGINVGSVSLREAINAANSQPGDDMIDFSVIGTINLTGGLPALSSNIAIYAPGPGGLTVKHDTGGDYGIFSVTAGATVTLSGMTIANGHGADKGGGINNAGNLALINCALFANQATDGGGIYSNGTLDVTGCTFTGNLGDNAGGIDNNGGTLTVTNTTFSENSAFFNGAGIFNGGTLAVTNSTFSDNQSGGEGGGIFNTKGTLTLTDSSLTGNVATGDGGVVFGIEGTLTVMGSTLSGNSVELTGGGICLLNGNLSMHNTTLSANTAGNSGGGVYMERGNLGMSNCTFAGNSADFSGGGICDIGGGLGVTNCTLSGNSGADGWGGGIAVSGVWIDGHMHAGFLTLINSIVANSPSGGDIFDDDGNGGLDAGAAGTGNLIEDGSGDLGPMWVFGSDPYIPEDILDPNTITGDPMLGPLANNGGLTQTMALPPGSPAVNAGVNRFADGNTDQRGSARFVGTVDIGAFELNRAPTAIALSNASVPENMPAGTVIGTLSTTDPDAGDAHTYSLVDGVIGSNDNASFTIDADGTLRTAASFDYEAGSLKLIRVRSTDAGGLSIERVFFISVINMNDAPTDISLSQTTVAENQPAGTIVSTFSTTDQDAGDTFTYTLPSGFRDNASFTVDATGTLRTAAAFDYEATRGKIVLVFSTDAGGLSTNRLCFIGITNVNEAPTSIALSNTAVAENQPAGTFVGTFSSSDPDSGDTFTYTLPSGFLDNSSFTIDATGALRTAASFDYEATQGKSILVRSTDAGGLSNNRVFIIGITNVNEAPTAMTLSNASVAENLPGGTPVGTLTTTDPDAGDLFTYSLVDGTGSTDNAVFVIQHNHLLTNGPFDFEQSPTRAVRIRTTDMGGLSHEDVFTINISDRNEAPTAVALSNNIVAENQPAGTVVGTLSTVDQDAGDTHTYTAFFGDTDAFEIVGNQLRTKASFDFESKNAYAIHIRSIDAGGLSAESVFAVTVTNVNETPTAIALSNASVAENLPTGTAVGTLATTDPDAGDTFTYAVVGGDIGAFSIDAAGNLKTASAFDYETKNAYSIRVRSTDAGGLFTETDFSINVTNVNEAPTLAVPTAVTAFEDVNQAITGITVGDPEGDSLTVTLMAGHGTLTLGSTTGLTVSGNGGGVVTLAGSIANLNAALATLSYRGALNFSVDDWLTVTVGDGNLSTSGSTTLHVQSAAAQATTLQTQVTALQTSGVLNSGQANALKLDLKGNNGDVGKVQAFLNQVQTDLNAGILTQAQADALTGSGRILLQSVSRR